MLAAPDKIAVLPTQTGAAAFDHLARRLSDAFVTQIVALATDDSPEPVHKARVALRRFRSALVAFDPILADDLSDALQDRARTLFRLLGSVRDADVMAARFAGDGRAKDLAAEAARQRQKLRRHLKRKKAAAFHDWVSRRLAGKGWRRLGKKAKALREAPVQGLADLALGRAWARCESNGADLRLMSARAQHDLRKDLKLLRYLAEFFDDLWPGPAQDAFLATLRQLQDDLGELTDGELARSLGHAPASAADSADLAAAQQRAARAWTSLLAHGPWWAGQAPAG